MTSYEQLDHVSFEPSMAEFSLDSCGCLLRVEATALGVFRIRCAAADFFDREARRSRQKAQPMLSKDDAVAEMIRESTDSGWVLGLNQHALHLHRQPLRLVLEHQGEPVVTIQELHWRAAEKSSWKLALTLDPDDRLYGLGLTSAEWDRRGQEIFSDSPDHHYQSLMWTTGGWGSFVNSSGRCVHASTPAGQCGEYTVEVQDDVLDFFLFAGPPETIFNQYTALTGRPGQPSLQAIGTVLRQPEAQSDDDFIALASALRKQGVSVDTLQFSAPSTLRFQSDRMSLEWSEERFNQPLKSYFERLKEEGWHLAVSTFPGVPADTELFEELEDRGWLLTDESGQAYRFEGCPQTSGRPFGLLDLTFSSALQFWTQAHQQLLDQEQSLSVSFAHIRFPDGVEGRHGDDAATLNNLYPILLEQSLHEALAARSTPREAVVMRDFITPVSQRVPWLQLSMKAHTWEQLRALYRESISLQHGALTCVVGEIGNPNCSEAMPAELYLRLLAYSVFTGNFVFHAREDLLPTHYDEHSRRVAQQWLSLRYRLIPYVLGIIEDSLRTGLPVQRSMPLAFPDDPEAWQFAEQFMFGPALLVAPILAPGGEKMVYLPKGQTWWDLNTSEQYEGGQLIKYSCDTDTIPAFGCDGHMLSIGQDIRQLSEFNSAKLLKEIWMFGRPEHNPTVLRNRIRVMQMQGSSYIKGLEGLKIVPSDGLEVKRRGAEVRISPER